MAEAGQKANAPTGPAGVPGLGATLMRVAWLAIILGCAMEVLLLVLATGSLPSAGTAVADFVKSVSWSVIVCAGLAVGTVVSELRAPLMGLLGLLAAPLAFTVARSLHQSAEQVLAVSGTASAGQVSLVLIALLKGIEYACLGVALGWIGRRPWGGALAHISAGLAAGVVFGGAIVSVTYSAAAEPLPAAQVLSMGVNEIIFPVGCSLVLYVAAAAARWQSSESEAAA